MKEFPKEKIEALAKRLIEKEDICPYKHRVITKMNEQHLIGVKLASYFVVDDWADLFEKYCDKYGAGVENKILAACARYFKKKWEANKCHVVVIREEGSIAMGMAFNKKPEKQAVQQVADLYNFRA